MFRYHKFSFQREFSDLLTLSSLRQSSFMLGWSAR